MYILSQLRRCNTDIRSVLNVFIEQPTNRMIGSKDNGTVASGISVSGQNLFAATFLKKSSMIQRVLCVTVKSNLKMDSQL